MEYIQEVDRYIEKAEPFAQPILNTLRALIAETCPEAVECIKWSFPNYEYAGRPFCSMAAFKKHCAFGFWNPDALTDPEGTLKTIGNTGMGNLGKITSLENIPDRKLLRAWLLEAAELNKSGKVAARKMSAPKKEYTLAKDFRSALQQNPGTWTVYQSFSPSKQREYLEWIETAKTEATRTKRMGIACEWISEGKGLNWKYEKGRK